MPFSIPRNVGPHEGATHFGQVGDPGGGPYALIWFTVEGDTVTQASYQTYGCPAAVACASLGAQLAHGRTVSQLVLSKRAISNVCSAVFPKEKVTAP